MSPYTWDGETNLIKILIVHSIFLQPSYGGLTLHSRPNGTTVADVGIRHISVTPSALQGTLKPASDPIPTLHAGRKP